MQEVSEPRRNGVYVTHNARVATLEITAADKTDIRTADQLYNNTWEQT